MTTELSSCRFISKKTRALCMSYLEDLGGAVAHGIFLSLKHGDDASACSHSIDPLMYNEPLEFSRDYLAASFLSKFTEGPKGHESVRRAVALEKFWCCESRLQEKASVFKSMLLANGHLAGIFHAARERIALILGPIKDVFSIDDCDFGPGASSSVPRRKAHPSNKFLASDVSAACAPFVGMFFSDLRFPRPVLQVVEHSRIQFVPKNFKTDRVIAIEPDWNIFFQKGVGKAIRKRLRRVGLHLSKGAERHAKLSLEAALSGQLATVDLSSASDSIATWLVRFLLPDDWFFFMNSIRTASIEIDDVVHPLTKFSSMGNGFTFELETLVFYALAVETAIASGTQGTVTTYGDDIILPSKAVPLLQEVFDHCGFVFNKAKSFSTGYFRESCGAHYFRDWDVKPFYLKESVSRDVQKYHYCNSIRRLCHRLYYRDVYHTRLRNSYSACRNLIRKYHYIPEGYGDGGLVSYFDETPAPYRGKKRKHSAVRCGRAIGLLDGFKVRCLLPVTTTAQVDHDGMYLHKLRKLRDTEVSSFHAQRASFWLDLRDLARPDSVEEPTGNEVVYASKDVSYRVGHMYVPRWLDPGQA